MKNSRNGQAEVLSESQLTALLDVLSSQYRALFAICYYSSCRISEALKLEAGDIIGDRIVFRAATTKTGTAPEPRPSRYRLLRDSVARGAIH